VNPLARQSLGSSPTRKVVSLAFCGAIAVGVLAGCGHEAPQARQHASISGLNTSIGNIGIRNAQITLDANGNAALTMALFNSGTNDTLTAVSSPLATDGALPGGETITVTSTEGVFLTNQQPIVLSGLKKVLVGADVPVLLTFKGAGTATLQIPIVKQDDYLRVGPAPETSESVGPSTSASPSAGATSTGTATDTPTSIAASPTQR
jgi:copper(I)-binding protein